MNCVCAVNCTFFPTTDDLKMRFIFEMFTFVMFIKPIRTTQKKPTHR